MKIPRISFIILATIVLTLAACSPVTDTPAPSPDTEPTAGTPAEAPTVETPGTGLTEEVLKNSEYIIVEENEPFLVRLTDGAYQYGVDPAAEDYVSISLSDVFAFGDLNGDGAQDAVALLVENYGGTGVFLSLVAVVDENGLPKHVSTAFIDDRPIVYSLEIRDGDILMNVVVHAPDDPMCCPSQGDERTYRLEARGLHLTHLTSSREGTTRRVITIDSPAQGSEVGRVFPLKGSVSIAPFENNLVVRIFDAAGNQVYIGPLLVNAPDMGAPGTFDASISLEGIEISPGPIRIEVEDVSMADGSTLALDSVQVTLKQAGASLP